MVGMTVAVAVAIEEASKGLSQKLLIRLMAQPFAMQFCAFRQNKRKSLELRQKRV